MLGNIWFRFSALMSHSVLTVFWHIDDRYVGSTRYRHQLEVNVSPGRHVLYLVDEYGNTLSRSFTVVENS